MLRQPYIGRYLVGYHGCDKAMAERLLCGKLDHLSRSTNKWDWLGPGTYFWVDSPQRAMEWATTRMRMPGSKITTPYAVGALIHAGRCLNLTDCGATEEIMLAYKSLKKMSKASRSPLPENDRNDDFGTPVRRSLDCAVLQTVHQLRKQDKQPPYDTVMGVFEEGGPLFEGSAIRERTHIQIAVLNAADCIVGYFNISGL